MRVKDLSVIYVIISMNQVAFFTIKLVSEVNHYEKREVRLVERGTCLGGWRLWERGQSRTGQYRGSAVLGGSALRTGKPLGFWIVRGEG